MNRRAIWTIVFKDLKLVRQSRMVMLPLILLPLIMFVILPGMLVLIPSTLAPERLAAEQTETEAFLQNMPAGLKAELDDLNETQMVVVMMTVYFLAPMYLIVPTMVASVIAADSFVGERERKTMEGLLYTPITESELMAAKMLAALIPAILVALIGFVAYALVINLGASPIMGRIFFPNVMWIVLVVWVAPATAALGLGVTVLVSSRVKTFQEAYQFGGLIVLPLVLLVVGQAAGVVYLSAGIALALGLILWAVDLAILAYGVRSFRRGEIIARL